MSEDEVRAVLARAIDGQALEGKRVLVLIPDATYTAPIALFFRLLYEQIGQHVKWLDYLIALGTHPAMTAATLDRLVGVAQAERLARYPNVQIFHHRWDMPETLQRIGEITRQEMLQLTGGLFERPASVQINQAIFDYDLLIICGPVVPDGLAGFSGGARHIIPGIAGAEMINTAHWLSALATNMATIGTQDNPVRRLIHRAAEFIDRPLLCLALVSSGPHLYGLYAGSYLEAWSAAAMAARLHIVDVPQPFHRVLAVAPARYPDLWTAAKAMYQVEPAVADGGEVIIYAPHVTEISYTHRRLIDEVGYHVRDYFLQQWERFSHLPGSILAHSARLKGAGSYSAAGGVESPRIRVTLATGIPAERCRKVNLGYVDYRAIDLRAWENREDEGLLLVADAGEVLYRYPLKQAG